MSVPSAQQLSEWTARTRASDAEAFAALFDALQGPLLRYARSFVRDEASAYDLLQETFTRLWEMRGRLDPERSVKALLFRIIRNLALKHIQSRRMSRPLDETADGRRVSSAYEAVEAGMEAARLQKLLGEWIAEMPDRRREVFSLSRLAGLTHIEIASVLGISPRTVNNHLVAALRHIRGRLEACDVIYKPS